MAVSGSSDFALTARDYINEAAMQISLRSEGMPALSAFDAQEALRSLNLLLKTWSIPLHQWLTEEATLTPLLATATYALTGVASKPYRVLSMRRRVSNIDIPMEAISREEYFDLPTKTQTGTPLSFYYDSQRDNGTIYLWPTPDASFVASGSLPYTYTRQIQDADTLDDDLDIPQEWTEAVIYGLARRLMIKYPSVDPIVRAEIRDAADKLYAQLTNFDQEDTSVFLQPSL
jgi:hypothetical protein